MPAAGTDSEAPLPKRILLASPRRPLLDEHGFVLPLRADEALGALDLLLHRAALVVAPPWTGKTFVAEKLHSALRSHPDLPPGFGGFCARTCFETLGRESPTKPAWWESWSAGDRRASWIVDAVDEDERSGDRRIDEILGLIEDLPEETRSRLHVLFFCRESEVPPAFLERAGRLFGDWSPSCPGGLRRLRLAGLDRESARALVGDEAFERICRVIEANQLKELAALPVVLEHLRDSPSSEPIDRLEVWQGVLQNLLWQRPGRPGRTLPVPSGIEMEDRFEVVQWLAAVLTFSSLRELRVSDLEDLFPRETPGGEFRLLREAAREALRTAVFEPAGEGFRFAQDHVREWFAALALRGMPLVRARPLLTDGSGRPHPAHAGVLDLLSRIVADPGLRSWIDQEHGGIVPPSSSLPWTLEEAVRVLDRLQELARSSPWGLALWNEEHLRQIGAPGLGAEIARRLKEPLLPAEQELLLDVALAVGASRAISPAAHIVQDRAGGPRVRALAADLLARLGSAGDLAALEPWVLSPGEHDGGAEDALPMLVAAFLRTGLWDFETAAGFALSRKTGNGWLEYHLAERLNLEQAWRVAALASELGAGSYLVRRAVELIRDQGPEVRRRFFEEGLASGLGARELKAVLREDDAEWLLELARARDGKPEWLQETVYLLASREGVGRAVQFRMRQALDKWGSLRQLDEEREIWQREEAPASPSGAAAEEAADSSLGGFPAPDVDLESLPSLELEQLSSRLIEGLPPESAFPGREEDLCFLRDAIPALLLRRGQEGDAEALERLAAKHPSVRSWLDHARAQQGAEGLVAGLVRTPGSGGHVPVAQVVRLLQDGRYRLLRTHDDLQAVVREELERIAADAKNHLAMLYRPRDKSGHLHEDALQAYLHCRLGDRLGSGVLEPRPIFQNREPLAARNTRNDLKIQTTALDGRPLTLIIEVKWSDNADMPTSLVEQLGKGYLLENGLTHGIYLVGWCGRGASGLEALRTELEEQARLFRLEQPEISIAPVVLDLTWD